MIRGVLADTGPLYAATDEGDADHQRAVIQTRQLQRDKREVLIAYPILLEAYSLVLKRLGTKAALGWLEDAANASLVNPSPADYAAACAIVRVFPDQGISLVDATVATLATRMKIEVWTYDHHFDVMRVAVWRK